MEELKTQTSVEKFVEQYSSAPNASAKAKLCEGIVVRKYVPILEKYSVLLIGFNRAVRDNNGMVVFNGVMQYIMYVMLTLKMYTDLALESDIKDEGAKSSLIDYYDMLRECGAIDQILLAIGTDELTEIERINQAIIGDVKENELNPYMYVPAQLNKIRDIGKEFIEMLYGTEALNQFRDAGKEWLNKAEAKTE